MVRVYYDLVNGRKEHNRKIDSNSHDVEQLYHVPLRIDAISAARNVIKWNCKVGQKRGRREKVWCWECQGEVRKEGIS